MIGWEPGRGYRARLSEMEKMPLEEAQAEIALTPLGDDRTKVTWSMDFRVKFGPLGRLMGQTKMKPMMGKVLGGNLQGLAKAARTSN